MIHAGAQKWCFLEYRPLKNCLTCFLPILPVKPPWKRQKIFGFRCFFYGGRGVQKGTLVRNTLMKSNSLTSFLKFHFCYACITESLTNFWPMLPQACNFIKKETLTQVFSRKFCKVSKNTFFTVNRTSTTRSH